jgi:hypothetical protein
MLFELCDRVLQIAQTTVMTLGTDVLFRNKQGQKETFIEQNDQYQYKYHGITVYFVLDYSHVQLSPPVSISHTRPQNLSFADLKDLSYSLYLQ